MNSSAAAAVDPAAIQHSSSTLDCINCITICACHALWGFNIYPGYLSCYATNTTILLSSSLATKKGDTPFRCSIPLSDISSRRSIGWSPVASKGTFLTANLPSGSTGSSSAPYGLIWFVCGSQCSSSLVSTMCCNCMSWIYFWLGARRVKYTVVPWVLNGINNWSMWMPKPLSTVGSSTTLIPFILNWFGFSKLLFIELPINKPPLPTSK